MKIKTSISVAAGLGLALLTAVPAQAGSEDYIGEVFMTAAPFCPRDTADLNGKIIKITDNMALFSLLGTTYGGDGRTTFGLPDMRGRSALHAGTGPGLGYYMQGSRGGAETQMVKPAEGKAGKTEGNGNLASSEKPINVRGPYLTLRYCIVLKGTFPSRP